MINHPIIFTALIILSGCTSAVQQKDNASSNNTGDSLVQVESPAPTPVTNKKLSFKKFSFDVNTVEGSTNNSFTIIPAGYSISNDPITESYKGILTDVIVGDIDADNNPELALVVKSENDDTAQVFFYSSNKDRSMSRVNFEMKAVDSALTGYQGHDEFLFVGNNFVRRFSPYQDGKQTNKMRHLTYKLKKGEASKYLVLFKVVDL
jgi:hypothetical protein